MYFTQFHMITMKKVIFNINYKYSRRGHKESALSIQGKLHHFSVLLTPKESAQSQAGQKTQ